MGKIILHYFFTFICAILMIVYAHLFLRWVKPKWHLPNAMTQIVLIAIICVSIKRLIDIKAPLYPLIFIGIFAIVIGILIQVRDNRIEKEIRENGKNMALERAKHANLERKKK